MEEEVVEEEEVVAEGTAEAKVKDKEVKAEKKEEKE